MMEANMIEHQKIVNQVIQRPPAERKKAVREIADTICLSVDESPPAAAVTHGAAALAALHDLCMVYGIDTVYDFVEVRERLHYLLSDMTDDMRAKFPSLKDREKKERGGDDVDG